LDIRLSIDQLVEVLKKHKHPKHVLVPFHVTASTSTDGSAELADSKGTTSTSSLQWSAYKVGEAIQLGMGSLYETVLLSEEVMFQQPMVISNMFGKRHYLTIALYPHTVGQGDIPTVLWQSVLCCSDRLAVYLQQSDAIGASVGGSSPDTRSP
jgi:hypothetical protein